MLNKRQIEHNAKWLINYGSPPVRYLTYKYLLRNDSSSKKMKELWEEVERCHAAEEIFSKQQPNGSWCADGSWALPSPYLPKCGYTPVSPKYVTTAWILPTLGDMGFTLRDKRIKKACEYILSFQCKNGFIAETDVNKYDVASDYLQNMPCRFAVMLIGLGKVGAGSDLKVTNAYDLLVKWQRSDGGWVLEQHFRQRNWTRSCPWSSYHAAMALYCSNNEA